LFELVFIQEGIEGIGNLYFKALTEQKFTVQLGYLNGLMAVPTALDYKLG